jgi:site-specific DNA-cytosine methylase
MILSQASDSDDCPKASELGDAACTHTSASNEIDVGDAACPRSSDTWESLFSDAASPRASNRCLKNGYDAKGVDIQRRPPFDPVDPDSSYAGDANAPDSLLGESSRANDSGVSLLAEDHAESVPSTEEAPPRTVPLARSISLFHAQLDPRTLELIRKGVAKLEANKGVSINLLFAGCDMTKIAGNHLKKYWQSEFGKDIPFTYPFSCEIDPDKRLFLQAQYPEMKVLLSDAKQLAQPRARNEIDGKNVRPPPGRVTCGGFSCTDKSTLSSNRSTSKTCISGDGPGSTNATLRYLKEWTEKDKPDAIILENLQHIGVEDLAAVLQMFTEIGYMMESSVLDAESLTSRSDRTRRFFYAFKTGSTPNEDLLARLKLVVVRDAVGRMRYQEADPFFSVDEFLMNRQQLADIQSCLISEPRAKKEKTDADMKYKKDHLALYERLGLSWPPSALDMQKAIGKDAAEILSVRGAEVGYACHVGFPPSGLVEMESLDTNHSLCWSLGVGGDKGTDNESRISYPWRALNLPTIAGSSIMVVRRQGIFGFDGLRVLTGVELLNFMGFDSSELTRPVMATDSLLGNMAGNAFSGFSIAAVLSVVLPLLDLEIKNFPLSMVYDHRLPTTQAESAFAIDNPISLDSDDSLVSAHESDESSD